MKYFAILKDSLREALDSKIIYVMFGLSALVVLVAATLTFEPGSPRTFLQSLAHGHIRDLPGHRISHSEGERLLYRDHRAVEGRTESPDNDLIVRYLLEFPSTEAAKEHRAEPKRVVALVARRLAMAEELEVFRVGDIRTLEDKLDGLILDRTIEVEATLTPGPVARRLWPHKISLLFGAIPLGNGEGGAALGLALYIIGSLVMRFGGWIAILISVIITAFFIPNMLRKGTIDLLLVKPIHRPVLLIYKYVGGLTFIFLNTAFVILGIWLALGLRSGIWANGFLLMIFSITFYFAILYAVSALFGVLTQSAIVSILMTCGAWFVFFLIGFLHHMFEDERNRRTDPRVLAAHKEMRVVEEPYEEGGFARFIHAIYTVTPRTADLTIMADQLMYRDFFSSKVAERAPSIRSEIRWGESLSVSLGFVALTLALSCWWFSTRDY